MMSRDVVDDVSTNCDCEIGGAVHRQTLSFTVRVVRTQRDLLAACRVRAISYGHHVPQLREALIEPDLLDVDEHTINVLCVDKKTGSAVGTARFQTNTGGPLLIEHSVSVPERIQADTRAEITRLSAVPGSDRLVRLCLMKASYLFCVASQVRWMVIGARNEALERQYRRLGFRSVFQDERTVPLIHAGGLEHKVMAFNVTAAERAWREPRHPLYEFIFETAHPDIQMFSTEPALPRRARRSAASEFVLEVPAPDDSGTKLPHPAAATGGRSASSAELTG